MSDSVCISKHLHTALYALPHAEDLVKRKPKTRENNYIRNRIYDNRLLHIYHCCDLPVQVLLPQSF
jgi:hypothetical protein